RLLSRKHNKGLLKFGLAVAVDYSTPSGLQTLALSGL
ncbi:hypothetical protein L195_g041710, partial [Trifolium pratense]